MPSIRHLSYTGGEQPGGKQSSSASKAREDPSVVQIARKLSALLGYLLRVSQLLPHPDEKLHRPPEDTGFAPLIAFSLIAIFSGTLQSHWTEKMGRD